MVHQELESLDCEEAQLQMKVFFSVLHLGLQPFWKLLEDLTSPTILAASFQQAVIDVLTRKIKKAVEVSARSDVIIAGGVAANKALRSAIKDLENLLGIRVFYPSLKYCGDNAAMIAFVGSLRSSDKIETKASYVRARWPLNELTT